MSKSAEKAAVNQFAVVQKLSPDVSSDSYVMIDMYMTYGGTSSYSRHHYQLIKISASWVIEMYNQQSECSII